MSLKPTPPRRVTHALPIELFKFLNSNVACLKGLEHTCWLQNGAVQDVALGAAITCLARYVDAVHQFAGVEVWLRSRPCSEGMPAHLDKDEALARRTGEIVHPAFASVLYLNALGGSTFVTMPGMRGLGDDFLCPPEANVFLLFPGNWWHGVVANDAGGDAVRSTLLLNWWERKPEAPACLDIPEPVLREMRSPR